MSFPLLVLLSVLTSAETAAPEVLLGAGEHTYRWVSNWLKIEGELGNTHGDVVVDGAGRIFFNTDTKRAIIAVHPDGSPAASFGEEFERGLHGMTIAKDGDREVLFISHLELHQVVKMTLDGQVLMRILPPMDSGVYDREDQFRPTGIAAAPNGDLYVADGYGLGYVHRFKADGTRVATFGGPGNEPGKFRTPHGLCVDQRHESAILVIADRENGRLQSFDLEGNHLEVFASEHLRRPCKVFQQGDFLVVPDLAGRVTILGPKNELVAHLGDQPDPARRARNDVDREHWKDGEFLSPHSAAWDRDGNLYVMDWNFRGRISKLERVRK